MFQAVSHHLAEDQSTQQRTIVDLRLQQRVLEAAAAAASRSEAAMHGRSHVPQGHHTLSAPSTPTSLPGPLMPGGQEGWIGALGAAIGMVDTVNAASGAAQSAQLPHQQLQRQLQQAETELLHASDRIRQLSAHSIVAAEERAALLVEIEKLKGHAFTSPARTPITDLPTAAASASGGGGGGASSEAVLSALRQRVEMLSLEKAAALLMGKDVAASNDVLTAEGVALAQRCAILERERESLRERCSGLGGEVEGLQQAVASAERDLKQLLAKPTAYSESSAPSHTQQQQQPVAMRAGAGMESDDGGVGSSSGGGVGVSSSGVGSGSSGGGLDGQAAYDTRQLQAELTRYERLVLGLEAQVAKLESDGQNIHLRGIGSQLVTGGQAVAASVLELDAVQVREQLIPFNPPAHICPHHIWCVVITQSSVQSCDWLHV